MFGVCTSVTVLISGFYCTSCKTFANMLKQSANIAVEFLDVIQIIQSIFSSYE
jgi:aerobic-type carbon monoxide dehydrogenase small subunit (CoxS/CutS family)